MRAATLPINVKVSKRGEFRFNTLGVGIWIGNSLDEPPLRSVLLNPLRKTTVPDMPPKNVLLRGRITIARVNNNTFVGSRKQVVHVAFEHIIFNKVVYH